MDSENYSSFNFALEKWIDFDRILRCISQPSRLFYFRNSRALTFLTFVLSMTAIYNSIPFYYFTFCLADPQIPKSQLECDSIFKKRILFRWIQTGRVEPTFYGCPYIGSRLDTALYPPKKWPIRVESIPLSTCRYLSIYRSLGVCIEKNCCFLHSTWEFLPSSYENQRTIIGKLICKKGKKYQAGNREKMRLIISDVKIDSV